MGSEPHKQYHVHVCIAAPGLGSMLYNSADGLYALTLYEQLLESSHNNIIVHLSTQTASLSAMMINEL